MARARTDALKSIRSKGGKDSRRGAIHSLGRSYHADADPYPKTSNAMWDRKQATAVPKARWSKWRCFQCQRPQHLERDPDDKNVYYCQSCWSSWGNKACQGTSTREAESWETNIAASCEPKSKVKSRAGAARIWKDNLDLALIDVQCNPGVVMPGTCFQYGAWKNSERDPGRNISYSRSCCHTWENKARMNTQTQIRHDEKPGSDQIPQPNSWISEAVNSAEKFKLLGHSQFQAKRWEEALDSYHIAMKCLSQEAVSSDSRSQAEQIKNLFADFLAYAARCCLQLNSKQVRTCESPKQLGDCRSPGLCWTYA